MRNLQTAQGTELSLSAISDLTITSNWRAEIAASWARIEDDIDTPSIAPGVFDPQPAFTTVSDYRRAQFLFVNRYQLTPESELAFGLDLIDEQGRDDGSIDLGFALIPS